MTTDIRIRGSAFVDKANSRNPESVIIVLYDHGCLETRIDLLVDEANPCTPKSVVIVMGVWEHGSACAERKQSTRPVIRGHSD